MHKVFGYAPKSIRYAAYLLPPLVGSYLCNDNLPRRLQFFCLVSKIFLPDFDPIPQHFQAIFVIVIQRPQLLQEAMAETVSGSITLMAFPGFMNQ